MASLGARDRCYSGSGCTGRCRQLTILLLRFRRWLTALGGGRHVGAPALRGVSVSAPEAAFDGFPSDLELGAFDPAGTFWSSD